MFGALADPTRRAILARLAGGDANVAELAAPFRMSQPAISRHLKVLERAGLISRNRQATARLSHLEAGPLAPELGRYGIRVVTLQTAGVPESIPAGVPDAQEIVDDIVSRTLLGRAATLADVGDVAAFAASDRARTIAASAINITCGTAVG